ncbi:NAD-dependent protein deacetylase Sirt6 [Orchesella cincta]|uniref:protein acetyllysine N-acetyltransferase n=1 Tax=Orchesella cincta TaxID=48709 RepID=A0A1D2MXE1_ORCCI|nr:NAD-dependent protein deacetylase Sirt6 [Orchesella cincta]
MSCNYAEGLSPYEHKGKLGLPEFFDDPSTVDEKIEKLAEWIKAAKHVVIHTGAGISTSAGIPDFRGPNGVWTLEEKGEKPKTNISFDLAAPTFTHMALSALIDSGHIKYIVSQNIDGLHLRSGLKRSSISELHGNMFVAQCSYCDRQFIQGSAVPTVGQKEMGLNCPWMKAGGRPCRGKLHDNILDWEHNLPDRDLEMADMHSTLSDLSISLGTTLQIVPAGNLPLRAKRNGGKVVIVNLQQTKHHKKADLVIHLQVDKVLQKLTSILDVRVPPYTPDIDPTRVIKRCVEMGLNPKILDWTIAVSSIKKVKALVAVKKGDKAGDDKKRRNQRKRRRAEEDDSSSDESEIPKPKFTVNDNDVGIGSIQKGQRHSNIIDYNVPLDLTTVVPKERIKTEVLDDANLEQNLCLPTPSTSIATLKDEESKQKLEIL